MILVQNMTASRVNFLQNDFAAGLPSPFAFLGLLASIAPRLGVPRWQMGVLPILHSLSVSPGRTRGNQIPKGNRITVLEISEDHRGTVVFSLLVDPGQDIDEREMAEAISTCRLAGGMIFPASKRGITASHVPRDGSAFRRSARGRVILPMSGQPILSGHSEEIMSYADALFPEDRTALPGWRVPVAAGYLLLEDPQHPAERRNLRDPDIPHVFAEPVAGIAELVSPRNPRLTGMGREELTAAMWRYNTAPATGTSFGRVAAHSFYL